MNTFQSSSKYIGWLILNSEQFNYDFQVETLTDLSNKWMIDYDALYYHFYRSQKNKIN